MSPTSSTDAREAGHLREAMADKLIADGWISSPAVEEAFRRVPRHLFVPDGTTLKHAYDGALHGGLTGGSRSPRRG